MKKGLSALLLASLLCASSGCQQNQKEVVNEYNIVPMPNQMTPQEGRFLLSNKVSVVTAGLYSGSTSHCGQLDCANSVDLWYFSENQFTGESGTTRHTLRYGRRYAQGRIQAFHRTE